MSEINWPLVKIVPLLLFNSLPPFVNAGCWMVEVWSDPLSAGSFYWPIIQVLFQPCSPPFFIDPGLIPSLDADAGMREMSSHEVTERGGTQLEHRMWNNTIFLTIHNSINLPVICKLRWKSVAVHFQAPASSYSLPRCLPGCRGLVMEASGMSAEK